MMRTFNFLLFVLLATGTLFAAKEPKEVAAARKSVVSILVYKDGTLLRSGIGVFAGEKGDILSSYSLFLDADSAVCIDPAGKIRSIERVVGADDIYDCIRVRAAWDKKIQPLAIADGAAATGASLYMVSYGKKKSGVIEPLTVAEVSTVSGVSYYTFNNKMHVNSLSAPVVDASGRLVALMQPASPTDSLQCYAVAASLAGKLTTTSLTYNGSLFNRIGIARALPATQKEALTTLYLLQGLAYSDKKELFLTPLADYNRDYPQNYEGHLMLAEYYAIADSAFDKAQEEWDVALSIAPNSDDIYYNISKVFVGAVARYAKSDETATAFIDSAIENIDKALSVKSEPLYIQHKAELLFVKGEYAGAFDCYVALSRTNMSSAEVYAAASKCKEALGEFDEAIVQMDSAIAMFGSLPVEPMAPYLLNSAMLKHKAGRAREAVVDFNRYESLREGRLTAPFYYMREQAEYDAKMYRQALDDIERAISMASEEPLYFIEKARLCYRVKMVDEALSALSRAVVLAPENPDVHYLMGRCYMAKDDKESAQTALLKAKEYGHPDADARLTELNK